MEIEERVDVIGDVVHLDDEAFLRFENAHGLAALGAEDEVDESFGEGLGHGGVPCNLVVPHTYGVQSMIVFLDPGRCTGLPCNAPSVRVDRRCPW